MNGNQLPITGTGEETRDFTFVQDTVRGFLLAIGNKKTLGQTINIGSNFEISVGETINVISDNISVIISFIKYKCIKSFSLF